VARHAGVSPAAVSFAVNDRPGVSPATRERILAAARELGWRPSASARALTEARTRAIGLVLEREPAQLEVDAFFVRFLSGIERTLAQSDYALLLQLVPPGTGAALAAYERLAAAGRVDGFLLTDPALEDPRFPLLEEAGLPVAIAGRPVADVPFPWVETEHQEGATAVVEHLAALGHERIGFLGGSANYEWVQRRRERWQAALEAAGLEAGPVGYVEERAPAAAAEEAVQGDATAVFCTSDALALTLVAAAHRRGVAVPGELSVSGFDDSPLAALASPPLTSVRVDYAEFGAAAAAVLLAAVAGERPPDYRPSPPELMVRASTAARRR
jgi:LacI family transcriptional regulator, repressor for deo operon, udp, cdd, tsx, nupC, and nupG